MKREEPVIEVKDASKQIKTQWIFQNINLAFYPGTITGLVGRNGSGKTMIFKAILGLIAVTQGEVRVRNQLVGVDVDIPNNVGAIIETPGFLSFLSGFENLWQLALIEGKLSKTDVENYLVKVGLDPNNNRPVSTYSMGMRQRLGIAQALMEDPEIIILDEPFNGLDTDGVDDMRQLLLTEKEKGKCILLASHNKEDIDYLCDAVYRLDAGQIVETKVQ